MLPSLPYIFQKDKREFILGKMNVGRKPTNRFYLHSVGKSIARHRHVILDLSIRLSLHSPKKLNLANVPTAEDKSTAVSTLQSSQSTQTQVTTAHKSQAGETMTGVRPSSLTSTLPLPSRSACIFCPATSYLWPALSLSNPSLKVPADLPG